MAPLAGRPPVSRVGDTLDLHPPPQHGPQLPPPPPAPLLSASADLQYKNKRPEYLKEVWKVSNECLEAGLAIAS